MMNNSRNNSTFVIYSFDDTNSEVDLNEAMILSNNEEMLFSSNDASFDRDAGILWHMNQAKNHTSLFELSDSTTFMSLPSKNRLNHDNRKSTSNVTEHPINFHNSREEILNKRVPLSVQLRRIFKEILEKHGISVSKSSINSPSRIGNSLPLENINLQNERSDELDVNNNDPVYEMAEVNNPSLQYISQEESYFLNKYFPRKLVRILENTYGDDSDNSELENFIDSSYINRLRMDISISEKTKRQLLSRTGNI